MRSKRVQNSSKWFKIAHFRQFGYKGTLFCLDTQTKSIILDRLVEKNGIKRQILHICLHISEKSCTFARLM